MAKTIILALPYLYGLDQCIEKNLRYLGYEVINLCYDDSRVYYPTILHRIKSWLIKLFYGRAKYKEYEKRKTYSRYSDDIDYKFSLLGNKKADFALCIRANVYPKSLIKLIRQNTKTCVNFQWDGIDSHPDILECIEYFDRFFVFDPNDIKKYSQYKLRHITNFYFDYNIAKPTQATGAAFFLGGHQANRVEQIKDFIAKAKTLDLLLDFYIVAKDKRARIAFDSDPAIHYVHSSKAFSFEQNLYKVQESFVVVDFLNTVHQGLSFRSFDALRFDKKLITTNTTVVEYDFYHPNNILVWKDNTTVEELEAFLALPYQPIPCEIKQKYSFSIWLNRILYS